LLVGLQWDLSRAVTLGLAYRSKLRIDMDGPATTTLAGLEFAIEPTSRWTVPHMLRAGLAGRMQDDRLLLSAEVRAQLHGDANSEQAFRSARIAAFDDVEVPLGWRNVYTGSLGLELQATESVAFRMGASVGNSATPESTVTPFVVPPGILYTFATGLGHRTAHVDLNLAFAFTSVADTVVRRRHPENCHVDATVKAGCDGRYSWSSYLLGVSLGFHP
jgi:long-subunit fatty acid transport protein